MSVTEFKIVKFLGKGSYGSVYKVIRHSDGKEYAMKEVKMKSMSLKEKEEAVNEIRILASIRHPNVVRYHEAFIENQKIYIITEYCRGGDLHSFIERQKAKGAFYSEDRVWSMFIQMLLGLSAVHSMDILHRDMKSPNIFLSDDGVIKIGDLGVAKFVKHSKGLTKTQVGTPYYVSPEIWKNRSYDARSDVWSLGCLLYEIASLRRPFEASNIKELANKVLMNRYQDIPPTFSREMRVLVRKLLVLDPFQRPSVADLLRQPYITSRFALLPPELREDSYLKGESCGKMRATIKFSRHLTKAMLPSPSYPSPEQRHVRPSGRIVKGTDAHSATTKLPPAVSPTASRQKENVLPMRPERSKFPLVENGRKGTERPPIAPRPTGRRRSSGIPRPAQYHRRIGGGVLGGLRY
eukprot:TRINITY_DN203_c2_g5_i1.p1 TRINITY_DN203_c2_g5~~TRINITY_DN203_c2_g5_i1.p1  ORF type:complete len:408 (+),score=85.16 TRINITY_DN203_c2_g5_i1:240-1463(+)